MKFLRLKISEFGTYGPEVPVIDFGNLGAVVLIMGKRWDSDMDSNGSGKSLIFEALCWALFNQTSRGTTAEGVIRPGANTCTVEFSFESGGETYRIVRVRSRTGKKHSCNFSRVDDDVLHSLNGASIDETQNRIQDLIGMDFKAFRNSVMYGQGDESTFIEGTDSERKSVFASLIQMEDLDKCHKEANDRVKEWGEKEEGLSREIDWNQDLIKNTPQPDTKSVEQKIEEQGKSNQASSVVLAALNNKEEDAVTAVQSATELADEKQAAKEKISQIAAQIHTLQGAHVERRRKIEKDIGDAESAPTEIKELEGEIKDQEAQAKTVKNLEGDLEKARVKLDKVKERVSKAKEDLAAANVRHSNNEDAAIEFRRIVELGENKCPTCGAEITKEALAGHIKEEYQKAQDVCEISRKDVEKCTSDVEVLEERENESLADQHKVESQISDLRGNDKLPLLQSRMGTLKEKQSRLEQLRKDLKDVDEEHGINRDGILKGIPGAQDGDGKGNIDELLDVVLDDAKHAEEDADNAVDDAREEQRVVTQQISQVKQDMAVVEQSLKSNRELLLEAKKVTGIVHTAEVKIGELEKKLANVQVEKADYEILSRAFPEIKTALIEDSIPFLEESINRILDTLTDGVFSVSLVTQVEAKTAKDEAGNKKLKEKFEIWISDGQAVREFRTFSGGEKKIIKLALRLALAELSMEFSGKAVHHLLLDEVLGDLDQHKQAQVIDLIRSLSKRFQVLIISHQEIAKEKFDSVLTVARSETSTIEIGNKPTAA